MRAPRVRLIDEEGKLIGVMSSREAFDEAKARNLDLVEIHSKSDPVICKIMDYGKWKFETKKKEKQNKKKQNKVLIKEIQIRTRTDEGDIQIKLTKAKEFLNQGHKVKINLRFFGREMAHKDLGFKNLKRIENLLSDIAEPEMPAKMERRTLFTILAPLSPSARKAKKLKANTEEGLKEETENPLDGKADSKEALASKPSANTSESKVETKKTSVDKIESQKIKSKPSL